MRWPRCILPSLPGSRSVVTKPRSTELHTNFVSDCGMKWERRRKKSNKPWVCRFSLRNNARRAKRNCTLWEIGERDNCIKWNESLWDRGARLQSYYSMYMILWWMFENVTTLIVIKRRMKRKVLGQRRKTAKLLFNVHVVVMDVWKCDYPNCNREKNCTALNCYYYL